MSNFILTIFIISFITFITKVFLPIKKTSSILSLIFAIISILIVIQPIKGILKYDFSKLNQELEFNNQSDPEFISTANELRANYYLSVANFGLKELKLKLNDASFEFDDKIGGKPLKKIKIYRKNLVIIEQTEHIDIAYKIKQTLAQIFSIQEKDIEFYD